MTDDTPSNEADPLRRALLAMLPSLALAHTAAAQDAAKMLPGNYRVALDNNRLRALEFVSRPGMGVCGTGVHSHPAHLTVMLSNAKARVTVAGRAPFVVDKALGDVFWSEAETHEVENISGKDVRSLLIELKPDANPAALAQPPKA